VIGQAMPGTGGTCPLPIYGAMPVGQRLRCRLCREKVARE
jgi:hypothetical protein